MLIVGIFLAGATERKTNRISIRSNGMIVHEAELVGSIVAGTTHCIAVW
jgi:hypothetical protein